MGISPNAWGPYAWGTIHLFCLGAPETLDAKAQKAFREFFEHLPYVLPCPACQQHLLENLDKVQLTEDALATRESLFAWSVRLHNLVNLQTKKPEMSVERAKEHWTAVMNGQVTPAPCTVKGGPASHSWHIIALLVLALVAVLVWTFAPRRRSGRR